MPDTDRSHRTDACGAQRPSVIEQACAAAPCAPGAEPDVGAVLRRMNVSRDLSDDELEQHIVDLGELWRAAYARFQQLGDPHARDEALLWLHEQNAAILRRSPAVVAAREAEFQRRLDEGCGYFIDQAERDRKLLAAEEERRRG